MIIYNKLEIKGDKLILDLEFDREGKPYYDNSAMHGVRIDTSLTYGTKHPYFMDDDMLADNITLEVPIPQAKRELFIITPLVIVDLPFDAPCGADIIEQSAIYNERCLDSKGLAYLNELGSQCTIPKQLIDFILKKKALDMSISTCNYHQAVKYWNMLNKTKFTNIINGCECNRTN